MSDPIVDVVVPTVGRPSLQRLLDSLAASSGPRPGRLVIVDDRPRAQDELAVDGTALDDVDVVVLQAGGRGPAAARNVGWRACTAPWVAFLDDDVVVPDTWLADLAGDLGDCGPDVAASQGRIVVPLPTDRRPTDWERNVAGLEDATWATADMAYRRRALAAVGGFDERFRRAYREDADLGLRVSSAGWAITRGRRHVTHPVRPAPDGISVAMQAGNAEDPFMRALHGPGWRDRAAVPRGRRRMHLLTTGAAVAGLVAAVTGRPRTAAGATATWLGLTARFAWLRIAPGPRTRDEVVRMAWTSAAIPPVATAHWLRGLATLPARLRREGARPDDTIDVPTPAPAGAARPAAVLFDRDGTLVHDVPYNGDPAAVRPVDGAREALDRLRDAGIRIGVVTNQSGIARGLITPADVDAVNARVESLLGPVDVWAVCPHGPDDGCGCRKPQPGLVHRAAQELGVPADACIVIGDIGSDVGAARAAGAGAILVPTPVTLEEEVRQAPLVATDIGQAVALILDRVGGPVEDPAAVPQAVRG